MGRQTTVHLQPIVRRDQLVEAQRRDAADFLDRVLRLGRCIVRQATLEIAQNGIPGVAPDADDVGETELGAIGIVDALECLIFGVRQPVEADAVLFGAGFRGQARRALRLVGEIGMRPDQRKAQLGGGAIDRNLHRLEQRLDAGERPHRRRLLGDPRRILENIRKRGDEVVLAACIQIGECFLRHFAPYDPISNASVARCERLACQCCAICSRVGTQTRS